MPLVTGCLKQKNFMTGSACMSLVTISWAPSMTSVQTGICSPRWQMKPAATLTCTHIPPMGFQFETWNLKEHTRVANFVSVTSIFWFENIYFLYTAASSSLSNVGIPSKLRTSKHCSCIATLRWSHWSLTSRYLTGPWVYECKTTSSSSG